MSIPIVEDPKDGAASYNTMEDTPRASIEDHVGNVGFFHSLHHADYEANKKRRKRAVFGHRHQELGYHQKDFEEHGDVNKIARGDIVILDGDMCVVVSIDDPVTCKVRKPDDTVVKTERSRLSFPTSDDHSQMRLCPLRGRDSPVYLFLWFLCGLNLIAFATGLWEVAALTLGYAVVVSCLLSYFSMTRSIAWCVYCVFCFVFTGFGVFVGIHFRGAFHSSANLIWAIIIFLGILLLAMLALSRIVPLCFSPVVGSSAEWARREGWGWQPEVLHDMMFGWLCHHPLDVNMLSETWFSQAQRYPQRLVQDVLNCRAYWCGEVVYDYIFMLCNDHDWIHMFFCFPGHGIARLQAILLVVMLASMAVFAAAAFDTLIHSSILRLCLVFVMVTVPRALLRKRLLSIAVKDDNLDYTHAHRAQRWGAGKWRFLVKRRLLRNNIFFYKFQRTVEDAAKAEIRAESRLLYYETAAVVLLFLALCVAIILLRGYSLGVTLGENVDVIAYMFVVRLWMQILIFIGEDRGRHRPGGRFLGFFHHWYEQRDQYGSLLPVDRDYNRRRHYSHAWTTHFSPKNDRKSQPDSTSQQIEQAESAV